MAAADAVSGTLWSPWAPALQDSSVARKRTVSKQDAISRLPGRVPPTLAEAKSTASQTQHCAWLPIPTPHCTSAVWRPPCPQADANRSAMGVPGFPPPTDSALRQVPTKQRRALSLATLAPLPPWRDARRCRGAPQPRLLARPWLRGAWAWRPGRGAHVCAGRTLHTGPSVQGFKCQEYYLARRKPRA